VAFDPLYTPFINLLYQFQSLHNFHQIDHAVWRISNQGHAMPRPAAESVPDDPNIQSSKKLHWNA